jgi:UDP-GlcNAc:undecaprenyl-phosphate GlcNAc-1-phosphate transferase
MIPGWVQLGPYFFCAIGLCAALVPVTARLANRLGIVALPTGRHIHRSATPRIGGLAIAASFFLTLGFMVATVPVEWLKWLSLSRDQMTLLLGGCGVILVGGFWDDAKPIRPLAKFGYQIAAAVIAWFGGAAMESANLPIIGTVEFGSWSFPLSVLWIVAITNAINLLDGLDGLAAGVSGMIAMGMAAVALYVGNPVVGFICVGMAGACFGFLVHNWYPARVFMGDCGSNFLGFFLGAISLIGNRKGVTAVGLAASFILLGLPVIDMLFSIFRRTLQGRSPFSADRGHLHHLLLQLGLSQRRVVWILFCATLVLGGIGMAAGVQGGVFIGWGFAAVLLLAGLTYRWFGFRVRNILLRERGWSRAVARTQAEIPRKKNLGAVWKSLSVLARMMGFGSAELHLLEPEGEEVVAIYRRRHRPSSRDERPPLCLDLGRNRPRRAQLILRDFRARRSAHMMHRVALLMPVIDAVDQYIDELGQSSALDEEIARHSA